jgi:predicted anti-sigma-YlaC factor YlaD
VNCDDARETVSAAADGEASAAERSALHEHLGGCADCRAFLRRVGRVDRMARVRPAEPVPDLVARVTGGAGPARLGRGSWMRPALAWVAVVLAGQNVPALVLGETAGADSHLARHLGAFGVALAIGFAYVAWRPHRAIGLLPLVAALVATMVASTAFDLLGGDRSPLAEAVHLPELAGLALLWMIAGSPGWRGRSGRVEAGSVPTT